MKIEEMKKEILSIDDTDVLKDLNRFLCKHWNEVERDKGLTRSVGFKVGDKVQWESGKHGYGLMTGTIEKKNITTAKVQTGSGNVPSRPWLVPFSMLTKVPASGKKWGAEDNSPAAVRRSED